MDNYCNEIGQKMRVSKRNATKKKRDEKRAQ